MEALVMRRPVIITEAVGMQEHGNIDFVVNRGLGAYAPKVEQILRAVEELMDPAVHAATIARLGDSVPRDGAHRIAELIINQLHATTPTADTERHVAVAARNAQTIQQADEVRIGARVEHHEPGVHRPRLPSQGDVVGVRVSAQPVVLLEQRDVMGLGQHVRSGQSRHSPADHSNPHTAINP